MLCEGLEAHLPLIPLAIDDHRRRRVHAILGPRILDRLQNSIFQRLIGQTRLETVPGQSAQLAELGECIRVIVVRSSSRRRSRRARE